MAETGGGAPPPPLLYQMLETTLVSELAAFAAASPCLRLMGRGDRHPVLVLPGFTADDQSTVPLRWAVRNQGYWTHGWRLGRNFGPTQRVLDGLLERLDAVHAREQRPVSVIGWSLGGIYARALARREPDKVRQVITMGTPFRMRPGDRSTATPLWEALSPRFAAEVDELLGPEDAKPPLGVPATSIYTRTDGVVRWYTCLEIEGPLRENIEVRGSHSGLGFNTAVLYAVNDRLAQREGEWRPFNPPFYLRYLYPRAEAYRTKDLPTVISEDVPEPEPV